MRRSRRRRVPNITHHRRRRPTSQPRRIPSLRRRNLQGVRDAPTAQVLQRLPISEIQPRRWLNRRRHRQPDHCDVGILGDPYLRQIPLPRIPKYRKPNLGSEHLPRTPDYCVANTAMSKPSQPAFLNGATPFSTARNQRRIRILQSLTNVMAQ